MSAPMASARFLDSLVDEVEGITKTVLERFGAADPEMLRRPPASGAWSAAQCLEHLLLINDQYLERIEAAVATARERGLSDTGLFRGGALGAWFARFSGPDPGWKVQAPKVIRPGPEPPARVVERFVAGQERLVAGIRAAGSVDLDRTKLASPLVRLPFPRFRLGDVLRFLVEHEKRHLQQAERAMEAAGRGSGETTMTEGVR